MTGSASVSPMRRRRYPPAPLRPWHERTGLHAHGPNTAFAFFARRPSIARLPGRERRMSGLSRASLISEVESAIGSGSSDLRLTMLRRVTDLFVGSAPMLSEDSIGVFDDVIGRLSTAMEEAV